jgi:hypothetical protein
VVGKFLRNVAARGDWSHGMPVDQRKLADWSGPALLLNVNWTGLGRCLSTLGREFNERCRSAFTNTSTATTAHAHTRGAHSPRASVDW